MDDQYITRDPLEFISQLLLFGFAVLVLFIIFTVIKGAWHRVDQWFWKRRRERWAREARQRGE
jgi:hypothetical protein